MSDNNKSSSDINRQRRPTTMIRSIFSRINNKNDNNNNNNNQKFIELLKLAAIKSMKNDPWNEYHIENVPAERVIRHTYDPILKIWSTDETIVKIEKEPFTHGSMRYCYRMKTLSPPSSTTSSITTNTTSTNHRFHQFGWKYASNYVAKAYITNGGMIDTSEQGKKYVQNDILLQCEAQYWANQFNHEKSSPSKIYFIRSYVIEFPDRINSPWLSCERYITGTDRYGVGYVKHNTNSGYVDTSLRRVTPQVFSAYTFYKSNGNRLVADIQGVADLYTDPMILSQDYRYGDGDLGPRGMALFFYSYRHCGISDSIGIPIFPLSKNELHCQRKYEEDEETMSSDNNTGTGSSNVYIDNNNNINNNSKYHRSQHKEDQQMCFDHEENHDDEIITNKFQKLDINRQRRVSGFILPRHIHTIISDNNNNNNNNNNKDDQATMRRSNVTHGLSTLISRNDISKSLRQSLLKSIKVTPSSTISSTKNYMIKSKDDIDEVNECIERSQHDLRMTNHDYHRNHSGQLKIRNNFKDKTAFHKSAIVRAVSSPILLNYEMKVNLGRVHYQLAILHGMGRFPETVISSESSSSNINNNNIFDADVISQYHDNNTIQSILPDHDVYSVLFHLSYAASLQNAPACLSLARIQSGLHSSVSNLLHKIISIDFISSKILLQRAMIMNKKMKKNNDNNNNDSIEGSNNDVDQYGSYRPKVAAGCLYYQILHDESQLQINAIPILDTLMIQVLNDTIALYNLMEKEQDAINKHKNVLQRTTIGYHIGDHVEGNYMLEGTYYPGIVMQVNDDSTQITVCYDDDGSTETLSSDQVRCLIPPTATQTTLGNPLSVSDDDAFDNANNDNADDTFILKRYEILHELSELQARIGEYDIASSLCEEASILALKDGQLKKATEWNIEAMEYKS